MALLLASALLLFLGIDNHGYISMEAMVLEGANNMLATGDWLVPRLYGEIYTYKPPLAYWLAAVPASLTETLPSAALMRLTFGSTALFFAILMFWLVGRMTSPRQGLLCSVASLGGVVFLEKVRLAEFDTVIAACVGCAIVLASTALSRDRSDSPQTGALWLACYGFLYLGFLAKGAPALMSFGPGLLVAAFLAGRFRLLLSASHILAATLFAGLVAAYVWSVVDAVGWQGLMQPADEAQKRGLQWTWESLGLAVAKPLIICAAFAPFSLFLPRALASVRKRGALVTDRLMACGVGFVAGGVATFTAVPTHEMRYYIPLAAGFGLSCGLAAEHSLTTGATRFESVATRILLLLLVPLTAASLYRRAEPLEGALLIVLLIATLIVAGAKQLNRFGVVPTVAAAMMFLAIAQALFFVPARAASRDLSGTAEEIASHLESDVAVWTAGPADFAGKHSSLYAYLGHRIFVFDPDRAVETAPPDAWFLLTEPDWNRHSDDLGLCALAVFEAPKRTFHLARRKGSAGCP